MSLKKSLAIVYFKTGAFANPAFEDRGSLQSLLSNHSNSDDGNPAYLEMTGNYRN